MEKKEMEKVEVINEVKKQQPKKFLGLTGKQWGGVGLGGVLTTLGFILGRKTGKKAGHKEGYVCGRMVGAIVNNSRGDEAKASEFLGGLNIGEQRNADREFVGQLRDKGIL